MPTRRSPRKKPAQERSKETVRALLQAAARILEQEGYERTSVNRIADVAGVSVGSLYQYFPTKEALVAAVAHKLSDDMLAVFQDGLHEDAMLPFHDAVRAVVVRTVRAFRVNPRLRQNHRRGAPRERHRQHGVRRMVRPSPRRILRVPPRPRVRAPRRGSARRKARDRPADGRGGSRSEGRVPTR